MAMMLVCVVFLLCAALILAKDHPTLPTQWVAETIEPGIGHVMESYNFVANPSNDQPSSMWTNYTGCERLIHVTSGNGGERYLLGCESLTCCKEPQQGNQVEFQIPNIHYSNPNKVVDVQYTPNVTITNFGEKIEADEWSWTYSPGDKVVGEYKVYTQDCADCVNGVQLLQWQDAAFGSAFYAIEFKNYRGIDPQSDEGTQFVTTFDIPEVCQGNILTCPSSATKKREGALFDNTIVELPKPTGKFSYRQPLQDSCNGPHEACCEAPMRDPNNCPDSARTSDCDAQKACCCA